MATSSQIRSWWSSYRCRTSTYVRAPFPGDNRVWNLYVANESKPAWDLFIQAMHQANYLFRESAGGTYNCRPIGGTDTWSLHAYALAVDLNPSKNRYGSSQNDYPPEFIRLVDSIKCVDGTPAFQWGGRWSSRDQMHWQINLSPTQVAEGLVWNGQGDEALLPLMYGHGYSTPPSDALVSGDQSHRVEDVRALQDLLNFLGAGLQLDGVYGPSTIAAVRQYTGGNTGNLDGQEGKWFGGNQYGNLIRDVASGGSHSHDFSHDHDGTYLKGVQGIT